MSVDTLTRLLEEMAEIVDKPEGVGGGMILLEAADTLRQQQRLIPPTEPTR